MNQIDNGLFSGEVILQTKRANAIIAINDYGLSRFAHDQLLWAVGMKGKEGIGGKLHLTNYRLIFESHSINRVVGKFSVFLPAIQALRDESKLISKRLGVTTASQEHLFVIWGVGDFMRRTEEAQRALDAATVRRLVEEATRDYVKVGAGLKIQEEIEAANRAIVGADELLPHMAATSNEIEASALLSVVDLLDASNNEQT